MITYSLILIEYLLHFIVIQWIYEKTSSVKIPRLVLPFTFLLECLGGAFGILFGIGLSITTPVYLLFYAYHFGRERTVNMLLFYAFYPLALYLLIFNAYAYFIMPGFGITTDQMNSNYLYFIAYDLLVFPTFGALSKILDVDFKSLRILEGDKRLGKILTITNAAFITYVIFNFLVVILSRFFPLYYVGHVLTLFGLSVVLYEVFNVNKYAEERFAEERRLESARHVEDLEKYSEQVEGLYEDLRSFRHDYTNVMISLNEAIQRGDIELVKTIYDDVLKESNIQINQPKYDMAKLSDVTHAPLKSLLSAKLSEAFEKGIQSRVEVESNVTFHGIRDLDLITSVAILCDNAIEAAEQAATPEFSIAIFTLNGDAVFVVENTTKEKSIDVVPLTRRGYSTKGLNRGLGLSNLGDTIARYDNITLETISKNYHFTQLLTISH